MLTQLLIRDIVLIKKLDVSFHAGLTIFTGETGAGKSILLDCLTLALGGRGDGGLVRPGAESGQVSAVFDIPLDHPVYALLEEKGFGEEKGTLFLKRIQTKDGRTRAFINDQPASLSLIRQIASLLVEIHGQHDDRALLNPESHRFLLDHFGSLKQDLAQVKHCYETWQQSLQALEMAQEKIAEASREADYLQASVTELKKLNPQSGEEEELAAARTHMMRSEKIAAVINETNEAFSGPQSLVPILANLIRSLERKLTDFPELIAPIIQALDESLKNLDEAEEHAKAAAESLAFDPNELERTEERLFALRAAARKYAVAVEDLPQLREKMQKDLDLIHQGKDDIAALEKEVAANKSFYEKAAQELSHQRHLAAKNLEKAVMAQLPSLKLGQAEFFVDVETDAEKTTSAGIDKVTYLIRTNPGMEAGSLNKVASGGELSRFLLALKVVLADKTSAPTLIFDEIDTGVGGAVADAIGKKLALLSHHLQVLSVTHAPQVAAKADTHFLISKQQAGSENHVTTSLRQLGQQEQVEEIARMLSGSHITEEARAAARQLLQSAHI